MKERGSILRKYFDLNIQFWLSDGELHFEAPETLLTDDILQEMKEDKQAIIAELSCNCQEKVHQNDIGNKEENCKNEYNHDDIYYLSCNQEQLWFFDKLNPNSSLYNIPGAIDIKGNIEIDKLKAALHILVERHDVLRTRIVIVDGEPMQRVYKDLEPDLPIEDLSDLPDTERKNMVNELMKREAQIPFDLSGQILFRVKLWIINSCHCILQMTVHHILSDGWSMGVLTKDLMKIYESVCLAYEPPVLPITNTYQIYVQNQRRMLEEGQLETQINCIKEKLYGAPQQLNLFTDRSRPNTRTYSGNMECLAIKTELLKELRSISKAENTSIFQIVLTAFQILLYRYTGQEDFVIGCLMANRDYASLNTVGYFVNAVPLRLFTQENFTFTKLLENTKAELQQSMEYVKVPFIKLVESMKLDRNLQHNPIFDILIVQENYETVHSDKLNLDFDYFLTDYEKSKFDLTLYVNENNGEYNLSLEYSTQLYNSMTIKRILLNFEVLLNSIVHDREAEVVSLQVVSNQEKELVISTWNNTARDYPLDKALHQHFEERARISGDAIAVVELSDVESERTLTYCELNRKANQLAYYLHEHGVVTDTCVCIMMKRSLEMVIGILGIMKAGAAYVPIDPDYPQKRVEYIIQDSEADHIIVQEDLKELLTDIPVNVISLDGDSHFLEEYPMENLELAITPENMAYMIYTSGSTGEPKGTMNLHKGICNRLIWMQEAFRMTPEDRVLQKTPYSFDVSVWEFFWPLMVGARLVMAKPQGHRDTSYIIQTILEQKISILHFVPSMLRLFLENPRVEECNLCLRYIICSGEAFSYELQKLFFRHLKVGLYNLYGPTEAAVDVTWYCCTPANEWGIVPIGKPIANTQIYILDQRQQPIPIGASGEIYIGGTNLARGYWNKKELTAEKFILNPLMEGCSNKLYRTGDRARFLEDGNIEFIDRIDFQVKIRGIRIEIGEIESTLRKHPSVSEAVVIANEEDGEKRLAAFIIPKRETLSESELRDYLRAKLPDYMCPAYFAFVDSLKLTPNGKIDRSVLRLQEKIQPVMQAEYIKPSTKEEKILAG